MIFGNDEPESGGRNSSAREIRIRARIAAAKKIKDEFEAQLSGRMLTFVSTALGVVAALFWQSAITDTVKAFIPVSGAWSYEIAVALLVTVLAVAAIFAMSKLQQSPEGGRR